MCWHIWAPCLFVFYSCQSGLKLYTFSVSVCLSVCPSLCLSISLSRFLSPFPPLRFSLCLLFISQSFYISFSVTQSFLVFFILYLFYILLFHSLPISSHSHLISPQTLHHYILSISDTSPSQQPKFLL